MVAHSTFPRKRHRRRDHEPRHRKVERRIARTAAAGAAGAVALGAALGLTAGQAGEGQQFAQQPTGTGVDASFQEERAGERPSRGLSRASQGPATLPRASAPAVRPAPTPSTQPEAPPPAPLPPVPADCEEYSGNKQIGCSLLGEFGFDLDEMPALEQLWDHESGWNHNARNPSSGACGIPQALPCGKMASAGSDYETNPATQIRWGLSYISDRYGSPTAAWNHFQANGWY